MKSKAYRGTDVNRVDAGSLARGHEGQALVVGVDVGKFQLAAVGRWADGQFDLLRVARLVSTYSRKRVLTDPESSMVLPRLITGDAAVPHGDDASRVRRDGRIMRDQQDGLAVLPVEAFQLSHDFRTGAGIEVTRRLVGQDNLWLVDQGASNGDTLLLSAGQLIGQVSGPFGQTNQF